MDEERIAGRYRLLERHGVGGMATVWRARDEWTGEVVAIKRLHPHVVADPVARARLEREAAALRAVDHPAIVRPRELIDDPAAPSLVMDFVTGRPLDERIAAGRVPPGEALAIAAIIADALAVAHDSGIVHRDIKPANILVDDEGAVHLVDFGIAALTDAPTDDLTAASTMVGTLRYAAPERLAGGAVTPRSDVWALGAVLYEMVTGSPAVSTVDPAAALAASRAAPPALDGLPPGVASVVARAMAVEPGDRYPDAIAMRDALAEADAPVDPDAPTAVVLLPAVVPVVDPAASGLHSALGAHVNVRRAGRWIALAVGGLIAATALFAVAAPGAPTGVGAKPGAGRASDAMNEPSPSARPSPNARPTASPKAGPDAGPGKGKGKGKGGQH